MPAVEPWELEARDDSDAWFQHQLPTLGQDAEFYPPDHPLTKNAEALRDEFLEAVQILVEEQEGPDSPAAQRLQQRLAAVRPPVCVFRSTKAYVSGRQGDGGIIVSDNMNKMEDTMAHEVAHFVFQHGSERAAVIRALQHAAEAAEASNPGSLTAITASDSGGGGRYLWPNAAKQLQNFARHLPAAMTVYEALRCKQAAARVA
ncbi:hypothetical protein ABPG75_010226 [Micractinium tetrahymenae]